MLPDLKTYGEVYKYARDRFLEKECGIPDKFLRYVELYLNAQLGDERSKLELAAYK